MVVVAEFAVMLVLFIGFLWQGELARRYLRSGSISVWAYAARLGGIIAFIRIAILLYATYQEWTGTQSLSILPLVLLLFPEGAVLPRDWAPTAPHVLLFSGLLALGSFGFGLLISALVKASSLVGNNSN